MSCSRDDKTVFNEDEWHFVNNQGSIVPKKELPSFMKKSNAMKKRFVGESKGSSNNDETEPEFEVIQESGLTTSTIISTTVVPPLEKSQHVDKESDDDWGIVSNPQENIIVDFQSTLNDQKLGDPSSDEIEVIQIPEKQPGDHVENLSDSSSTCSFDVIVEKKRKSFPDPEADDEIIYNGNEEMNTRMDLTALNFHLDFPTLVALFCLTTALGFVIGHGIGIATSLLVVKKPNLKIPLNVGELEEISNSNENDVTIKQDLELEGRVQKWRSMYRNGKRTEDEYGNVSHKSLEGVPPGLKEAHRHLSLENFRLKKTQADLQKQVDLMKVMSWHRRLQLDNLKAQVNENRSYIVEVLKKELNYLEEVYKREKTLADMWRNEERRSDEEQKTGSKVNSWKDFKERWNQLHKDEHSKDTNTQAASSENTCSQRRNCDRASEDIAASSEDSKSSSEVDSFFQQQKHAENKREPKSDAKDFEAGYDEVGPTLAEEPSSADGEDMNDLTSTGDKVPTNENEETSVEDDHEGKGESSLLSQKHEGSEWFKREVMEMDGDIVVAYQNKDVTNHMLYAFFDGKFREMVLSSGELFIMSMCLNCSDQNDGLVVAVQNNSPKPIDFFAVLPNGNVKHQKIEEGVKITIVHLEQSQEELAGQKSEKKPLVYEAVITVDEKLLVTPQEDNVKAHQEVTNIEEERIADEEDIHANDQETPDTEGSAEDKETPKQGTSNSHETVPESFLTAGEAYIFDQCSTKLYRRIVSSHQYPISEYQSVLSQNPRKHERVFYRFPRNMIFEKFVVRDELFNIDQGGSIEKEEETQDETEKKGVVSSEYDEDVSKIVKELLENRWEEGDKMPVVLTYDSTTRRLASIYVTFWKVKPDDVITHELLKYGKMENSGSITKITSYTLSGFNIVQIVRTDEIYNGHTEEQNPAEPSYHDEGSKEADESSSASKASFMTEDSSENEEIIPNPWSSEEEESFKDERSFSDKDFSENERTFQIPSGYEMEDGSENEEIIPNPWSSEGDKSFEDKRSFNNKDFSENEGTFQIPGGHDIEDGSEIEHNPENDHTTEVGPDQEKLSYAMNSELSGSGVSVKEENGEVCSLELGDSQETEYLTVCDGRNGVRTNERVERVKLTPGNKEEDMDKLSVATEDIQETVSYVYCGDGSVEKTWRRTEKFQIQGHEGLEKTTDEDSSKSQESGNEDTEKRNQTMENDVTGEDVPRKDDSYENDDGDQDDYLHYDNHDHYDNYDHYDEDVDDDRDEDYDELDDYDICDEDDCDDDTEDVGNFDSRSNARKWSDAATERGNDLKKREDKEKAESYKKYLKNKWHDLKLSQRQFEHGKKQHWKWQKRMTEEWKRMKEQYRKFQESLKQTREPQTDGEGERTWKDMKYRQQQFDKWKTQVVEELKETLKDEWEKLKKRHEEIEKQEKQLAIKKGAFLQKYQSEFVEYSQINVRDPESIAEEEGNVDRLLSAAWELGDAQVNEPNDDDQMESTGPMQRTDPTEINDSEINSNVDKILTAAWELKDTEELERQHSTGEDNENVAELDTNVDGILSAAWELDDASTIGRPHSTQTEDFGQKPSPRAAPGKPNHGKTAAMVEESSPTQSSMEDKQGGKFHKENRTQNQRKIQIKRLRDELDQLYKRKFSADGHRMKENELQLKRSPHWSAEGQEPTSSQSNDEDQIQPKCPLKCPRNTVGYNSESRSQEMSPEGPPVEKKSVKLSSDEKSFALMDSIRGYQYMREQETKRDDVLESRDAPLPPEERKLKKWRPKHRAKQENRENTLAKPKKKKGKKKKSKELKKDHSYVKNRNLDGPKKAKKQKKQFIKNRKDGKKPKKTKKYERSEDKWQPKVQ